MGSGYHAVVADRPARTTLQEAAYPVMNTEPRRRLGPILLLASFAGSVAGAVANPHEPAPCVPVGGWVTPNAAGTDAITTAELVERAAAAGAVLLGESHDSSEHHRWQLQTLIAIYADHPEMVIALEMFPRSAQPALDRWVAGEIGETEFLDSSRWHEVWRFEPDLYMPIFHFARMNRIPLLAVNVDRSFTRAVAENGFAAVPPEDREGIGVPAPASDAYEDMLLESWRTHRPENESPEAADGDSAEFRRFVESQLVWDRAMAQGIADAKQRWPGAIVAALMGSGHVIHGWGVSHQLQMMGQPAPLKLLPWDSDWNCADLVIGYADALFGIARPPPAPPVDKPLLGIGIRPADDGVLISDVVSASIAAQTGLHTGDVIIEIAGRRPAQPRDVAAAVARQAPGTWLPLTIRRDGQTLEFVAKFPPAAKP